MASTKPYTYTPPYCTECGGHHQTCEPHELSQQFIATRQFTAGHLPAYEETYQHCTGIIRAAAEAASPLV